LGESYAHRLYIFSPLLLSFGVHRFYLSLTTLLSFYVNLFFCFFSLLLFIFYVDSFSLLHHFFCLETKEMKEKFKAVKKRLKRSAVWLKVLNSPDYGWSYLSEY